MKMSAGVPRGDATGLVIWQDIATRHTSGPVFETSATTLRPSPPYLAINGVAVCGSSLEYNRLRENIGRMTVITDKFLYDVLIGEITGGGAIPPHPPSRYLQSGWVVSKRNVRIWTLKRVHRVPSREPRVLCWRADWCEVASILHGAFPRGNLIADYSHFLNEEYLLRCPDGETADRSPDYLLTPWLGRWDSIAASQCRPREDDATPSSITLSDNLTALRPVRSARE